MTTKKQTTFQLATELQHTVRGFIQSQRQCAATLRLAAAKAARTGEAHTAVTLLFIAQDMEAVASGKE